MKKKLFSILIITSFCIFLFSCKNSSREKNSVNIPKQIEVDSCLVLKDISTINDDSFPLGVIESFNMINDKEFVISTLKPAAVFLYNIDEKRLQKIGAQGKGPYEYLAPSIVKQYNKKIYIWCEKLTKLLVYSLSGKPLDEYTLSRGVKDFVIHNNYAFFYLVEGFNKNVVMLFDLNQRQFLSQGFGTSTKENLLLNINRCSGGLALDAKNLYFSLTSQPILYKVRLTDFQVSKIIIQDPDFINEKLDEDEDINQILSSPQSIKYIMGSDIINGLFCTDSLVILRAAVGKIEIKGMKFTDISKRRQKFYVLNKKLQVKYSIKAKLNKGCSDRLYSSYKDNIYTLKLDDDLETYILSKVLIPNS